MNGLINEPVVMEMAPWLFMPLLLFLTITQGLDTFVSGWTWKVTLPDYQICAVTGSSVVMPCYFTHPYGLRVDKVYWIINPKTGGQPTDIRTTSQYQGRVQYNTDIKRMCTMTLSDVRVTDTALYYVRIEAPSEKWQSSGHVDLTVKDVPDLVVQKSGPAVEGKEVILSCESHCVLKQNSNIMWKKNGQVLPNENSKEFILAKIRTSDEGDYSCALEDQEDHPSLPLTLQVMYPPKYTSILRRPAAEILQGDSVTLTCSSDANPSVLDYSWFRRRGLQTARVESQQSFKISEITSEQSGFYYCMARNEYGSSNSTALHLDVQYPPRNTSASVSPSGEIVEGNSVVLTCSSDANPPVHNYAWYRQRESAKTATQQVYSISKASSEHTGYYHCQVSNKHGQNKSTNIYLDVLYPPNRATASLNHTGDLQEGSLVTLTCSSDANPLVHSYTWYKKIGDTTSATGSGKSFTFTLTSTSGGLYHCEATNRIASKNSTGVDVSLAGLQHVAVIAGAAVALLLILIVVLAVFMSRKKTAHLSRGSRSTDRSTQDAADNDYVNVNQHAGDDDYVNVNQRAGDDDYVNVNPGTSDPDLSEDSDDDVQYTSVLFKSSRGQEVPLYSTIQFPKPHRQQEEEEEDDDDDEEEQEVAYTAVILSSPITHGLLG